MYGKSSKLVTLISTLEQQRQVGETYTTEWDTDILFLTFSELAGKFAIKFFSFAGILTVFFMFPVVSEYAEWIFSWEIESRLSHVFSFSWTQSNNYSAPFKSSLVIFRFILMTILNLDQAIFRQERQENAKLNLMFLTIPRNEPVYYKTDILKPGISEQLFT